MDFNIFHFKIILFVFLFLYYHLLDEQKNLDFYYFKKNFSQILKLFLRPKIIFKIKKINDFLLSKYNYHT
jgi:hypothetical protein